MSIAGERNPLELLGILREIHLTDFYLFAPENLLAASMLSRGGTDILLSKFCFYSSWYWAQSNELHMNSTYIQGKDDRLARQPTGKMPIGEWKLGYFLFNVFLFPEEFRK